MALQDIHSGKPPGALTVIPATAHGEQIYPLSCTRRTDSQLAYGALIESCGPCLEESCLESQF